MFRIAYAALALAVAACGRDDRAPSQQQQPPAPEPGSSAPPEGEAPGIRRDVTAWVGDAVKAAIGDLDGDGVNEIVLVDARQLRVVTPEGKLRASLEVPGGIQVLVVADIDRDGRAEVLTGWGLTREHMKAVTRVVQYRLVNDALVAESVAMPPATRHDVTAIVPFTDEPGFLFAHFASKYEVHSVRACCGKSPWRLEDLATIRMATAYARADLDGDGVQELIVGRTYGDDKGVDGDAFILRPDGTRTPIPALRGVRELAVADADGDGLPELFLADGWHQDYGRQARARVTWVRRAKDGTFTSEVIEDMPGQFTAGRLVPADVDGDGRPEIISAGNAYVRVFDRTTGRWRGRTIAHDARDIAAGELDGVPGAEILVVGKRSEIISLRP
ncbi:MAG: VCBS repeat-containing protein [Deltaproteobacteria bacterium]|nr:VCBS repeat-containing protein [Deltaproteobacteria bacterium]